MAIVAATCQQIRIVDPNANISLLSSRPDRDRRFLGISPIPRGWRGIIALFNAARKADTVICGGGGLFQDDDSLVKMPYWAIRLLFLRVVSSPINGFSIGAGPLAHPISHFFARIALRQLGTVSVRDPLAQSTLAPLTRKNVEIIPDPAFMLRAASKDRAKSVVRKAGVPLDQTPLVGVAVRRWFHKKSSLIPYEYAARLGLQEHRGRVEMSKFTEIISHTLNDVVKRTGAHIIFMPTYNVEHEADIEICRSVASRMAPANCTILQIDDPALYKSVTGLLSVALCGRMHAAILAASQGTPVIGLGYNQKFFGMFAMLNQEDRCFAMSEIIKGGLYKSLIDMLVNSIQNPNRHRPDTSKLQRKTQKYIEKIVATTPSSR